MQIGKVADGVVVGSAFIAAAESAGDDATPTDTAAKVRALVETLTGGTKLAPCDATVRLHCHLPTVDNSRRA